MNEPDRLIYTLEAELRTAQVNGDVKTLDRLIDDALMFTTPNGSVVGKADDLVLHRTGRLKIHRMEQRNLQILQRGPTAIVSVLVDTEATLDGAKTSGLICYTRVWLMQHSEWRIIAGHMSMAQP